MSSNKYREDKQEHYTNLINGMLQRQLDDIKKVVNEIEGILNANMIDIDSKAIRVLAEIQKVKFNEDIFKELQFMKQD
jgi:membrane carboxypeptidase/penicillin-binding protein PbpC